MDKIQEEEKSNLFPKLSRNTLILRRNLLAAAALILMVLIFNLEIDASKILGIEIKGLTNNKAYAASLTLLVYLIGHFSWNAKDDFDEQKIQSVSWIEITSIRDDTKREIPQAPLAARIESAKHGAHIDGETLEIVDVIEGLDILFQKTKKSQLWRTRFLEVGLPIAMGSVAVVWLSVKIIFG